MDNKKVRKKGGIEIDKGWEVIKRYVYNLLISLDQFGNTLAGGDPDETISSRVGKNPDASFLSKGLYRVLDWLQPNHCEKSIEVDEGQDKTI